MVIYLILSIKSNGYSPVVVADFGVTERRQGSRPTVARTLTHSINSAQRTPPAPWVHIHSGQVTGRRWS